jgi:hypothetical protein
MKTPTENSLPNKRAVETITIKKMALIIEPHLESVVSVAKKKETSSIVLVLVVVLVLDFIFSELSAFGGVLRSCVCSQRP